MATAGRLFRDGLSEKGAQSRTPEGTARCCGLRAPAQATAGDRARGRTETSLRVRGTERPWGWSRESGSGGRSCRPCLVGAQRTPAFTEDGGSPGARWAASGAHGRPLVALTGRTDGICDAGSDSGAHRCPLVAPAGIDGKGEARSGSVLTGALWCPLRGGQTGKEREQNLTRVLTGALCRLLLGRTLAGARAGAGDQGGGDCAGQRSDDGGRTSGGGGGKQDLGGRYWKRPWSRLQAQLDVVLATSGGGHSIPLSVSPTCWVYRASPWGRSCHPPGSKWGNGGTERPAFALTEDQRFPGWHQPRPVLLGGGQFQKKTSGPLFRN